MLVISRHHRIENHRRVIRALKFVCCACRILHIMLDLASKLHFLTNKNIYPGCAAIIVASKLPKIRVTIALLSGPSGNLQFCGRPLYISTAMKMKRRQCW